MHRACAVIGRGGLPLPARGHARIVFVSLVGAVAVSLGSAGPAQADRSLSVTVENDFFGFLGGGSTDRYYSSGVAVRFGRGGPDASRFAERLAHGLFGNAGSREGRVNETFGLAHSFFTPDNIALSDLQADEHPYAGYLRLSYEWALQQRETIDVAQVAVGVVGPWAQAAHVQSFWHSVVGSVEPQGWSTQLRNEPVVQFTWLRKWHRAVLLDGPDLELDLRPVTTVSLGNALIDGSAGLEIRLGRGLGETFGAPRSGPQAPGSGFFEETGRQVRWSIFAGVDGRAVGRNLFVEGNSFRDGPGRPLERFVNDIRLGAQVQVRGVEFTYTFVARSREFDTQEGRHRFGLLKVAKRF